MKHDEHKHEEIKHEHEHCHEHKHSHDEAGCCCGGHEEHEHEHCHGHKHSHDEAGCCCGGHDGGCGCGHHEEEATTAGKVCMVVGVILFLLGVAGEHFWEIPLLTLACFLVAYLLIGFDVLKESVRHIRKGQVFDEFFLMSVATIGAFIIGEYPEAVAVMFFYKVGEHFQHKAVHKARGSIKALVNIKPEYINLVSEDGEVKQAKPEDAKIGDVIEIRSGERVPLDGVIMDGDTSLDNSAITGESKLVDVAVGDTVLSGGMNQSGVIRVQVSKVYGDSTVARIMEMVESASDRKSETEQFITKFAKVYTPIVVGLAACMFVLMPLVTGSMDFMLWGYRACCFLVISCPCALVISVPLGFFGGIGLASKHGILIKGGNYLEAIAGIDTVAFDKTGTLTKGTFQVTEINCAADISKEELVRFAAIGESKSNHPIAASVMKMAETMGVAVNADIQSYEEIPGHGTVVVVDGDRLLVGNEKLLAKEGVAWNPEDRPETVVYVARNGEYQGVLVVEDQVKDGAANGIEKLRKEGIYTVMLSGDNAKLVSKVQESLGIKEAKGGLLPGDKLQAVEQLYEEQHHSIAFVGDGINDAPVLKRADVGIAMGGVGQDAAIEAADIVLMTDEIGKITDAIRIGKYTKQIVTENIIFSIGVKVFVIVLAAVGLSNMWVSVFADVGVALLAVLNSLRIYFRGDRIL